MTARIFFARYVRRTAYKAYAASAANEQSGFADPVSVPGKASQSHPLRLASALTQRGKPQPRSHERDNHV
jgi:hypothetical protein